jgi:N-acetylglucosamine malate deacetylase 1
MLDFGKKILVVAAHPDDEVLGAGGTIAKLKNQGCEVHALIVTDGSSTQYAGNEETLKAKHVEADAAAAILKIDRIIQWDFPDMRLDSVDHVDINKKLETLLFAEKYDTVFSQEFGDINMDHRIVYQSISVAVRPYPFQSVKNFLTYYVNSSSEWGVVLNTEGFKPNIFVDIEDSIELKIDSMSQYKSELRKYPHPRSLEAIRISAQYFGNMAGFRFAEPFRLVFSR